jgi:hypothetical protein
MKKSIKVLIWILVAGLIVIQFVPLNRENPASEQKMDLLNYTQAPEQVSTLLTNSCYDCHSNQTKWPWYSRIAPVSFVVVNHVNEGRDHLNFSDWGNFDPEDQFAILKHMRKAIEKGGMPLKGYVKLHDEANLSDEDKALIYDWIDNLKEEIQTGI